MTSVRQSAMGVSVVLSMFLNFDIFLPSGLIALYELL
jgi:hypothetical protein